MNACTSDSVGLHFRNVFAIAREVHRLSGGSYDVSVGALALQESRAAPIPPPLRRRWMPWGSAAAASPVA